jgi:ParB/RepB/Spo0J family partition protein
MSWRVFSYREEKMNTELITITEPKSVALNPMNARHITNKELKDSDLYKSIKLDGVQIPVMVVLDGDQYQLVYGERRLRCAQMLNVSLPAIWVTTATEEELEKAVRLENEARKELNVVEKIEQYNNAVALYKDIETAADALGVSKSYVARIVRAKDISKELLIAMRTLCEKYQLPMRLGYILELAKLPDLQQEQLAEEWMQIANNDPYYWNAGFADKNHGAVSVRAFKEYLEYEYTRLLSSAKFVDPVPTSDGVCDLCSECKKRSDAAGQTLLFDDVSDDVICLDPECMHAKEEYYNIAQMAEALEKDPNTVLLTSDKLDPEVLDELGKPTVVDYFKCKKTTKKAGGIKCYVTCGKDAGKTGYYELPKSKANKVKTANGEPAAPAQDIEERLESLESKRWHEVNERLIKLIEGEDPFGQDGIRVADIPGGYTAVVAMALVFGTSRNNPHMNQYKPLNEMRHVQTEKLCAWHAVKDFEEALGPETPEGDWRMQIIADHIWTEVRTTICSRLHHAMNKTQWFSGGQHCSSRGNEMIDEMRHVSNWLGIDLSALKADADEAIPEPTSWAKLRESNAPAEPEAKAS